MTLIDHRFVLFCLSSLFSVFFILTLHFGNAYPQLFSSGVFYLTTATLVLAVSSAVRLSPPGSLYGRKVFIELAVVTLVVISIFLVIEPRFRILADETNLLSTSYSLFTQQEFLNIKENLHYYHQDHTISSSTPHRPALYSTLVSYLHLALGFEWYHGFLLNFVIAALSIWLFFRLGERVGGRLYGFLCGLLLAAFPIFQINVTSSGFDALNMLTVAMTFALLYRFVFSPSPQSLELLLLVTLLAAQVRYESMVLLAPVGLVILLHGRRLPRWRYSAVFPLIPVLAIPIFWQKLLSGEFTNSANASVEAFAIERIAPNLLNIAEYLLDWNHAGYATHRLIVALAIIGVAWLGWVLVRRGDKRELIFLGAFSVGYLLISLAHLSYQYGDMRLAWISRLTQIHLLWIVPAAAYVLLQLHKRLRSPTLLAIIAILFWTSGISTGHRDTLGKTLHLQRQFNAARIFLQDNFTPESTLIIADERANLYTALGYSCVTTGYANSHATTLRRNLDHGLFQNMLYLESRIHDAPGSEIELSGDFQRRHLFQTQYKSNGSILIHQLH